MITSALDSSTLEDNLNQRRKKAACSSIDMSKAFARR